MTAPFQGFGTIKNLEENLLDRDALNNLGTTPIGDDINLFHNNLNNNSSITVTGSNINVSASVIYFSDSNVVFSNRTKLTTNTGAVYYVKNSNGVDKFQLSLNANLYGTVAGSNIPTGQYFRSDTITKSNIINYSPRRREPFKIGSALDSNIPREGTAPITLSVKREIRNYESYVDSFKYVQNKSIVSDNDFLSKKTLESEAFCIISDPDNMNSTGLSNTGPGLFIYNPETGKGVRAFSSNENVWKKNTSNTYLETSAVRITVGDLYLSNNFILEGRSGNLLSRSVTLTNITLGLTDSPFTHKVPITVNGELYQLCISNT